MTILNRLDRFVIGGFIGAVIVTVVSDTFGTKVGSIPHAANYIVYGTLGLLVAWLVFSVLRLTIATITHGRYAVEAFILDAQDNLLVYRHPHLKMQIPPGGRVSLFEFPHEAIVRHLQNRIGLSSSAYEFMSEFHHGLDASIGDLGSVERVPAPFLVQRELHRQRSFVRFHYDFIYVLRLLQNSNITFPNSRYSPINFVTHSDLMRMVSSGRSLPDVQNAYEKILRRLNQRTPVP